MVPRLRRRRISVPPLAFAGRSRRFRRAGDPGTAIPRSVSRRVRRHDIAREYGARTANEPLRLALIGSVRALRSLQWRYLTPRGRIRTSHDLARDTRSSIFARTAFYAGFRGPALLGSQRFTNFRTKSSFGWGG